MVYNLHGPFHIFGIGSAIKVNFIALTLHKNSTSSGTVWECLVHFARPFDRLRDRMGCLVILQDPSTSSGTERECLVHFARPFDKLRDRMGTYCYDFPVMIFLISLSLLSASMGVKLLMSTFLISSRMEASTGSSNWNRLNW